MTPTLFSLREFAESDELWAGCIQELYHKVEARIKCGDSNPADSNLGRVPLDFKRRWRVKRAVCALQKQYGVAGLRLRLALLVLGAVAALAVLTLEVRWADLNLFIYS